MFTNKKELVKQVNWALRLREPLCCGEVNDVRSKWTSEGYEVRFDGGSAMIAKKKNVPFFFTLSAVKKQIAVKTLKNLIILKSINY